MCLHFICLQNVHYLIGRKQWVKWNVVIQSQWLSNVVISFASIKLSSYRAQLSRVWVCVYLFAFVHTVYVFGLYLPQASVFTRVLLCAWLARVFAISLLWPGESSVSGLMSKSQISVIAAVPPLGFEAMKTATAVTAHKTNRGPFSSLEGLDILSLKWLVLENA